MSARLQPWASVREWRDVRDALARATEDEARGDGARRGAAGDVEIDAALGVVRAWRARGRVPLAADVTAMLVRASRAREGVDRGDADAARSATAMTLARLVNGVVDPKQKGRYAAPIATLAREVGLPRFLVDLRHECAHGTMPSAGALRRGARRALAWCRRWYWDEQARAFDAAFERVRGCVRAMCACEKDARGLRAREGRGAVESSSEEMDEDGASEGENAGRESEGGTSFKDVRERRRRAIGTLSSVCPKGAAHVVAEALLDGGWLRVVEDETASDVDDADEATFRASAEDWRPTLERLCQKWTGLFAYLFDAAIRGEKPGNDVGFQTLLSVAASGDFAANGDQRVAAIHACKRALASVHEDDWSDDPAVAKRTIRTLQKIAGVSKDEIKSASRRGAAPADALASARADIEALRATLQSGRKRKRDSRWERAEDWTPSPIGVVAGVSARALVDVAPSSRTIRVTSGVSASSDAGYRSATKSATYPRGDDGDDDDAADDDEDENDDGGEPSERVGVAAALNVAGGRVELSKSQAAAVAASVACLL